MQQHPWTEKETKELLRLHVILTPSQIAKKLGRSRDSIRHKLESLTRQGKITPSPLIEEQVASEPAMAEEETKPEIKPEIRPAIKLVPKSKAVAHIANEPLVWCSNCRSPVSSWPEHEKRMRHMGCKRPFV